MACEGGAASAAACRRLLSGEPGRLRLIDGFAGNQGSRELGLQSGTWGSLLKQRTLSVATGVGGVLQTFVAPRTSVVPPGDVVVHSSLTGTAPPPTWDEPFTLERAAQLEKDYGVRHDLKKMGTTTAAMRLKRAVESSSIPSMWENGPYDNISTDDVSFVLEKLDNPADVRPAASLVRKLWASATTRQEDMLALRSSARAPGGYVFCCKTFADAFADAIKRRDGGLSKQIKYLAHMLYEIARLQAQFQEVAGRPLFDGAQHLADLCSVLDEGNPLKKMCLKWANEHGNVELPKDLGLSQPLMESLDAIVKFNRGGRTKWTESNELLMEDSIASLMTADKLLVEEFDRLKTHLLQKLDESVRESVGVAIIQ